MKITITLSKVLMRTAIEDAAMYAGRREIERQTREQIKGTRMEEANISVKGFESYVSRIDWPEIPDTTDLTFEWTD